MSKNRMVVGINSCFLDGVHSTSNLSANNKTLKKLFFSRRSIHGGGHELCNT